MKLKQISDNCIECCFSAEELAERKLMISDLCYGSDKSRALIEEIIRTASAELNFDVEDSPIVVEAVPMSANELTFIITMLEYPEELDTRFSRFTPVNENEYPAEDLDSDIAVSNASDLFRQLDRMAKEASANARAEDAVALDGSDDTPLQGPGPMIYSFNTMEDLISLSHLLAPEHNLPASVYKTGKEHGVLLMVSPGEYSSDRFRAICDIVSEYSSKDRRPYGSDSLLVEHYIPMIDGNALEVLSAL